MSSAVTLLGTPCWCDRLRRVAGLTERGDIRLHVLSSQLRQLAIPEAGEQVLGQDVAVVLLRGRLVHRQHCCLPLCRQLPERPGRGSDDVRGVRSRYALHEDVGGVLARHLSESLVAEHALLRPIGTALGFTPSEYPSSFPPQQAAASVLSFALSHARYLSSRWLFRPLLGNGDSSGSGHRNHVPRRCRVTKARTALVVRHVIIFG